MLFRSEEVHFARELAEVLEAARANYRDLVVVAPPHFLGGLRGHLSDALRDRLTISLDRNWTDVAARELPARLAAARR